MRLHLSRLGKHFGSLQALAPMDLDVHDGEFISVVGPSGCGKSTLLRLIAGLTPASEGTLELDGKPVHGSVTELGIVFQQPVLLEWRTAIQNVLFQVEMRGKAPGPYRERALALLDQVGLREFADAYPHQLSGGMRQRVAIARGLLHDPSLLLMDEPFGALDALTRQQMRVDIEAMWMRRRMTVVFVTHSVDEAVQRWKAEGAPRQAVLLADRVVVMSPRPGRVDQILTVDLPRPRGLVARRTPEFLRLEELITNVFLERGVLTRAAV